MAEKKKAARSRYVAVDEIHLGGDEDRKVIAPGKSVGVGIKKETLDDLIRVGAVKTREEIEEEEEEKEEGKTEETKE
jgi:hypothetical protein